MSDITIEALRAAMFAHPGVKAVEEPRLYRTGAGGLGLAAQISVAAPDVDLGMVEATLARLLEDQFAIDEIELTFNDPGPLPAPPGGGALEKK